MNFNKITKRQVQEYILDNIHSFDKKELYSNIKEHFNINTKTISRYYLELEYRNLLETINKVPPANYTKAQVKKIISQEGDNLNINVAEVETEVKSLEDLIQVCDIDITKWKIISWQCKKWDLGIKNSVNIIETKQLYSVSAKLVALNIEEDLKLQKNILLKELFKGSNKQQFDFKYTETEKPNLLELALFDIHFGKLAHKEESGEDYDLKIACRRYRDAINALLSRVNISSIDRILLPIGNDMLTIDNIASLTTAGTPQDTDSRFYKIVRAVKDLLIETINNLLRIAPVDVIVCVGNHDQQTSFMIGEMLDAYYHNEPLVSIDNLASMRKYYKYGKTSFLFTHGDKEKHANLGMIFAAENPKLWASTTQRYIQIGHFHHNRKINYLLTEEFQGFQIQIMPSLSGSDAWHKAKGFLSLKQAKAFLYNKVEGLIGEFTYSV